MELRQLRYFIAVLDEGNFGRAAQRLRMAQPGLSQQIKALERSVGVPLIDRSARPVRPTEAGARLLPYAQAMVEAAARAGEIARGGTIDGTAVLRVGTPSIGRYPMFGRLLRSFGERLPSVDVRVFPSVTATILEGLHTRTLDAGLAFQPLDVPEGQEAPAFAPLGEIELAVILPETHRLASLERIPRAELLREPFLDWPDSLAPRLIRHMRRLLFDQENHPRRIELVDAFDESREHLVAAGEGVTAFGFPRGEGLPQPRPGVVYRWLEDPPALITYGIVWVEPSASPWTRPFVETARALRPEE